MVIEAYELLKQTVGVENISPLFDSFFTYNIGEPQQQNRSIVSTTDAAWAEDEHDIVFQYVGIFGEQVTYSHFWNPDNPNPYGKHRFTLPTGYTSGWYEGAYKKAEILYHGGENLFMPGGWSFMHYEKEKQVLIDEGISPNNSFLYMVIKYNSLPDMLKNRRYYFVGVTLPTGTIYFSKAYEIKNSTGYFDILFAANILGRIAHLIGDMSIPEHVKVVAHPCNLGYSSVYETWLGNSHVYGIPSCPGFVPSWFPAKNYTWQNAMQQGGIVNVKNKNNPMKFLMYTTAQITDCYRADRRKPGTTSRDYFPGNKNYNIIDPHTGDEYNEMHQMIQSIPTSFGSYDTEMQHMASTSFVYAIRSIAGLFYRLAVDANQIQEIYITVPEDYSTIAAAVSAASSGQIVEVSSGNYTLTSNITIPSGVTLTL